MNSSDIKPSAFFTLNRHYTTALDLLARLLAYQFGCWSQEVKALP
jgi:hypothetical protein